MIELVAMQLKGKIQEVVYNFSVGLKSVRVQSIPEGYPMLRSELQNN